MRYIVFNKSVCRLQSYDFFSELCIIIPTKHHCSTKKLTTHGLSLKPIVRCSNKTPLLFLRCMPYRVECYSST